MLDDPSDCKAATLTQQDVRRYFTYENGNLIWNLRPRSDFKTARVWAVINSRNGGKRAGTLSDQGYLIVKWGPYRYRVHHLVWLYFHGELPSGELDHINGVRDDNRIENLRPVTSRENSRNMARPTNNTSGFIGVSFRSDKRKWRAYITVNDRQISLGLYATAEAAAMARAEAERSLGFHPNHGR